MAIPETPVLIAGAGPVGLVLAQELRHHGVPCVIVERNLDTTRWPKMDITNCRSMELLRRLGLADGLRRIGVPGHYSFDVIFSGGLSGREITRWSLPSVDQWRERILKQNDGSLPREPYQRCSQEIFEAWLKRLCEKDPLITVRSGWRFDSLEQDERGVTAQITSTQDGSTEQIRAKFLVGCDGASSTVRKALGLQAEGRAVPRLSRLIHFKSRDLAALHSHGQFWHVFFPTSTIIAQDEVDTWTLQRYHGLDEDYSKVDPAALLADAVGRPVSVDRILVTSVWQGQLRVANRYRAGRVFLAGDAAHQNIPTGGYGMNTGVGDAVDIGWKLAAVLSGWGGPRLLESYEIERRPVAVRNVARSERHGAVHARWRGQLNPALVNADSPEGAAHRAALAEIIQTERGENEDHGIELGYRYDGSPIVSDESSAAPPWLPQVYTPTSWPGGRPPSLFLDDGRALFDQFGPEFTLLDFTGGPIAAPLLAAAEQSGLPVRHLRLNNGQARGLYERDLILLRPDQHVAWRGNSIPGQAAQNIVDTARGAIA
jgi:FAD-dependent monooxygenase